MTKVDFFIDVWEDFMKDPEEDELDFDDEPTYRVDRHGTPVVRFTDSRQFGSSMGMIHCCGIWNYEGDPWLTCMMELSRRVREVWGDGLHNDFEVPGSNEWILGFPSDHYRQEFMEKLNGINPFIDVSEL